MGDQKLLQQHEGPERHDRGEGTVVLLELDLERRAALARAQVAADERSRTALDPFGDLAEFDPDLVA